jgi:prophage regulatory protein
MSNTEAKSDRMTATENLRRAVADKAERILRRPEVEARTGLSRSTIYLWIQQGEFPKPVALGARLVGWRESDVNAWLEARTEKAA